MTDEQIEHLVTRIIQRLQPPVLVMVTAAEGYRQAIRRRLAGCGQHLHLALEEGITDAAQWQTLGKIIPLAAWHEALPSTPCKALLVPFLSYPLAADLVNGTLTSPVAMRLHDALLAGVPVLALRYHCDPLSELNQLHGAVAHSPYAGHMQATLGRLTACGVTLCTMNEMLEKLASGKEAIAEITGSRRYLTATDIMNNPTLASAPNALLTDAAVDFIKEQKRTLL